MHSQWPWKQCGSISLVNLGDFQHASIFPTFARGLPPARVLNSKDVAGVSKDLVGEDGA